MTLAVQARDFLHSIKKSSDTFPKTLRCMAKDKKAKHKKEKDKKRKRDDEDEAKQAEKARKLVRTYASNVCILSIARQS